MEQFDDIHHLNSQMSTINESATVIRAHTKQKLCKSMSSSFGTVYSQPPRHACPMLRFLVLAGLTNSRFSPEPIRIGYYGRNKFADWIHVRLIRNRSDLVRHEILTFRAGQTKLKIVLGDRSHKLLPWSPHLRRLVTHQLPRRNERLSCLCCTVLIRRYNMITLLQCWDVTKGTERLN